MSSSDKRRGAASTFHANNNTLRSYASTRSSNNSNVIAPLPRAQLGSRPSSPPPGTDNDGGNNSNSNNNSSSRSGGGGIESDRTSLASTLSKDNTASAAREKEAAMAQQLREKDDEIAELQRELAQLESEFARQVKLLSQNESETAAFWQAKHSGLNQQFLRTDTELRLLRAEVEVRDAERAELKEGWEALRREIRDRDDEIRRLHALNRGLKEQVSTSTRAYHEQTSDDQFGDDMARLGNGLQNWIMVNFRKTKIGKGSLSTRESGDSLSVI